jgi:hypothetical protein
MTKSLDDFFNLPSDDDIEDDLPDSVNVPTVNNAVRTDDKSVMNIDEMRGEHSSEMDEVHDELIKHARDIAELAFQLDPARSPRMFEVAAVYYKTAVDAKISKRDAQLKLMKLVQTQRKLELDEIRLQHEMGNSISEKADIVMVEDRNALLRRLKDEDNG